MPDAAAFYPLFTMNRVETHLAWGILMGLALLCVGIFFAHNGFLLLHRRNKEVEEALQRHAGDFSRENLAVGVELKQQERTG
jgi:hypothetical protein